jgi:hypothetical protein
MPIADRFSVAITEYEARDFSLVDVNGAQCSKGTTLARWAASKGIAAADVMAVGDNLNDVEMLDFAGVAVVMGNASDALKSRGYLLTGTNDEGGLADAIRLHALEPRSQKRRTRSRPIEQKLTPAHTRRHESIRTRSRRHRDREHFARFPAQIPRCRSRLSLGVPLAGCLDRWGHARADSPGTADTTRNGFLEPFGRESRLTCAGFRAGNAPPIFLYDVQASSCSVRL